MTQKRAHARTDSNKFPLLQVAETSLHAAPVKTMARMRDKLSK